jgi:ketosteroid isomerase-like protein
MSDHLSPEQADDEFFAALTAGDVSRLEPLLDERFLIVDIMSGAVADRAALTAALAGRVLEFERVELIERAGRHYGETAILVGRTEMAGSFAGAAFTAASRYTHVFVRGADRHWRLASAQGTQIIEP